MRIDTIPIPPTSFEGFPTTTERGLVAIYYLLFIIISHLIYLNQ